MRPGGNQAYHTASVWAVEGTLVALYARQAHGFGQHVDVSMHAATNVTTEAATYEWLVAGATVERQTFRHAAVRATPQRLLTASDGGQVIVALPRYAGEFRALADWVVELDLVDEIAEFFFLEMGVERGGILLSEIDTDPLAAAIYQAGSDALRDVAEHLPARRFFIESQTRGLPAGHLCAPEEVIEDEHFIARGFPVDIHHEDLGRTFTYPGAPFRATGSPWQVRHASPHIGEHNEMVTQALGLSPFPGPPGS